MSALSPPALAERDVGDEGDGASDEGDVATYDGFMSAITTALDLALDAAVAALRLVEACGVSERRPGRTRALLAFLQELALDVARAYVDGKRVEARLSAFLLEAAADEDYDYPRYFELHHGPWFHAFKARLAARLGR